MADDTYGSTNTGILGDSDTPGTESGTGVQVPDSSNPFDWKGLLKNKTLRTVSKAVGTAAVAGIQAGTRGGQGAPGTQHGAQLGAATLPAPVPQAARTIGSMSYQPSDPSSAFGR